MDSGTLGLMVLGGLLMFAGSFLLFSIFGDRRHQRKK